MAKILDRFLVYDGSESEMICSATFPDVCVMPSGRILVSFRGGPTKTPTNAGENGYYCWSDDGGRTFTQPKAPFGIIEMDGKPVGHARNFMLMPLGGEKLFGCMSVVEEIGLELPYFNDETEAIKNTQIYTFYSFDGGETFTEPKRICMQNIYRDKACVLTGPPQLLSDGRIMVNFEVYKTYYDRGPFQHNAACIYSRDGGKTWERETVICARNDIYAWDHRVCEMEPGHLIDFVWAFDRSINDYRNMHKMESFDGGYTWTDMEDIGLPGQAGNPVYLPDGRLALVYFDRTGVPTLKLTLSEDKGKTYSEPFDVYVHEAPKAENKKNAYAEAWTEMNKFTAGHCFQALLPDGNLLVVNYAGPSQHKTNAMLTKVSV